VSLKEKRARDTLRVIFVMLSEVEASSKRSARSLFKKGIHCAWLVRSLDRERSALLYVRSSLGSDATSLRMTVCAVTGKGRGTARGADATRRLPRRLKDDSGARLHMEGQKGVRHSTPSNSNSFG
jgi:hypothetical protein